MKSKNHKIIRSIFTLTTLFALAYFFQSCSDDVTNPNINTNNAFVSGYQDSEASTCMTLSTLASVNENNPNYMKDSLIIQLANTTYATAGKWSLVWGPSLNSDQSNMMYVVKDASTNPVSYAIGIRGTDWCFPTNWEEDILVYDLEHYPYGSQEDSIADGTLIGMNQLLGMHDPATGQTLVSFLNSVSGNNHMFITGHSLGGALATVMTSWFLDNGYGSRFTLKSYTFAAPTIGNPGYVDHFTNLISTNSAESHRVINPKDLVPRFSSELDSVILQEIPTFIPLSIAPILIAIDAYFVSYNIVYEHVGTRKTLGVMLPVSCGNSGTFDDYECWVGFEHTTSTYLSLLNAPQVQTGNDICIWQQPNANKQFKK